MPANQRRYPLTQIFLDQASKHCEDPKLRAVDGFSLPIARMLGDIGFTLPPKGSDAYAILRTERGNAPIEVYTRLLDDAGFPEYQTPERLFIFGKPDDHKPKFAIGVSLTLENHARFRVITVLGEPLFLKEKDIETVVSDPRKAFTALRNYTQHDEHLSPVSRALTNVYGPDIISCNINRDFGNRR